MLSRITPYAIGRVRGVGTINRARTVSMVNRLSNGPHNGPHLPGPTDTVKSVDIPPTRAVVLQNRARKEADKQNRASDKLVAKRPADAYLTQIGLAVSRLAGRHGRVARPAAADLAGRGESPGVRGGGGGLPAKREPRRPLRRVLMAEAHGQAPEARLQPPLTLAPQTNAPRREKVDLPPFSLGIFLMCRAPGSAASSEYLSLDVSIGFQTRGIPARV